VKRWVGLTPGQVWQLTETGEVLNLKDFTPEGELIFEITQAPYEPRLMYAEYNFLNTYIDERGGALKV